MNIKSVNNIVDPAPAFIRTKYAVEMSGEELLAFFLLSWCAEGGCAYPDKVRFHEQISAALGMTTDEVGVHVKRLHRGKYTMGFDNKMTSAFDLGVI